MGSIEDEITSVMAKHITNHVDRTIVLGLIYPESYTVAYGHDVSVRIDWLNDIEDGNWAYYDRTFYFSDKKQKTLFLLRWAE